MRGTGRLVLVVLLCAGGGCDGARPVAGDGGSADGAGGSPADSAPAGDHSAPYPDLGPTPKAHLLDFVFDKVTAPTTKAAQKACARDLDGDGVKDNMFADILAALALSMGPVALQKSLDDAVTGGAALTLLRVYADSLTDDSNARLRTYVGADLDADPKDNFSGSETLGLHKSSPGYPATPGKIVSGALAFHKARFTLLFPVVDTEAPLALELFLARVEGTLKDAGKRIEGGNLAGAISEMEMNKKFVPALMRQVCHGAFKPGGKKGRNPICMIYNLSPCTLQTCLAHVGNAPPLDLIKMLIKPDLDLDKDGKKESFSVGLGFSAVSCQIKD